MEFHISKRKRRSVANWDPVGSLSDPNVVEVWDMMERQGLFVVLEIYLKDLRKFLILHILSPDCINYFYP